MRFDDRFLEELKSRVRLSDVIGKTVRLKRQGREYAGLSPFSKEKTPSFFVNDDKGFWHDFSSGKHGDLIAFLQETERLSFVEAVERIAGEAGMALPEPDPQSAQQEKERAGLAEWMELSAAWFEAELRRPTGKEARAYLEGRGLPESEWSRFRLGFAPPGRTALKDYLIAKGARPGELIEAGLLIAPDDGGAPYDRFRDRIIFPIADGRGRIVSLGGRAMDPKARAKYLNGPESPLFSKGRQLYGLAEARKLLQQGGVEAPLVVVEGYMDVIACQRAKVAAVAPLGTALTEQQMEMLWRLHPEPTLSFDGDAAGQRAALGAVERAIPLLKPGRSFRFSIVVGGKDPDDVLREQGEQALRSQLSQTTPFVKKLFEKSKIESSPLDTPERRSALKVALRKIAASMSDPDLGAAYRDALFALYEELPEVSAERVSNAARQMGRRSWEVRRQRQLEGATDRTKSVTAELREEPLPLPAALAHAALLRPTIFDDKLEQVQRTGFGDERLSDIASELVAINLEPREIDSSIVISRMDAKGIDRILIIRISRSANRAHAPFLNPDLDLKEAQAIWSMAYDALMRLRDLEEMVKRAKDRMDISRDSSKFISLKTQRDLLKRQIELGDYSQNADSH